MKQELKSDIINCALTCLAATFIVLLSFVYLTAFSHMSDKDKEDIIIIQMMSQPQ